MSELLVSKTFWLVTLNAVLGLLVAAPLLLVLLAVARELLTRVRHRRRDVQWTLVPGIGRIPVLKDDLDAARVKPLRTAGGQAHGV